jgi:hypothetical protein
MGGFARNIPVKKLLAQWQSDTYTLLTNNPLFLLIMIFLSSYNESEQ